MSKKNEIWNKLKQNPINMTTKKLLENHSLEYKSATEKQLSAIYTYLTDDDFKQVEKITEIDVDVESVTNDVEDSFGESLFGYALDTTKTNNKPNENTIKSQKEIEEFYADESKEVKTYYEQRIEELNRLYPPDSNLGNERKKLETRDLIPGTCDFVTPKIENITPKKIAITRIFEINEKKATEENQILQERLTVNEADNIIAEIGYVCLNDGHHYKGRDAVLIVKHCLQKRLDSLGNQIPPYYDKPIYCLFGKSRVKRDSPVMVPISVKDKDGNWVDRMVKSDTKPDTAASVRDYINNGKIESAGYKQAQKVQSLTLYPEKFYLNDPRGSITKQYKTLEKEQELRHVVYRASDLPEKEIPKLRSQAFKSNGELRDFKTPGGFVGGTKKTKSKISSGGKSENNTSVQVFDKGTKFTLEKLGVVQLVLNTNSGIIDLIDYRTGKILIRVGEVTQDKERVYDWKFYKDLGELKPILKNKIESLIRPKQADSKGDINLVKTQILDGLKQQQIQKVTEERFGHYISERKIKRIKIKAYTFLDKLVNKESHPLYTAIKNEKWETALDIMTGLGLVAK